MRVRPGQGPEAGGARKASTERPPRLVLRFAVVTALGLARAGAVILGVIREIDQRLCGGPGAVGPDGESLSCASCPNRKKHASG